MLQRARIGLITLCLALGLAWLTHPARPTHAATHPVVTVYLHGRDGNPLSMAYLIATAAQQKQATPTLTAFVDAHGHVQFRGIWRPHAARPLVNIVLRANQVLDYHRTRVWLEHVLRLLAQRYGVRRVNLVGHSLGNTTILYYLLKYGHRRRLPRVEKWVAIAGNFDGIPGMHFQPRHNRILPDGRPHLQSPDFRRAWLVRARFPRDQIAILNIYGDLADGSHSDGRIGNASSRALGWLIGKQARSYRELRVSGPTAAHSRLRHNLTVATAADAFLWP